MAGFNDDYKMAWNSWKDQVNKAASYDLHDLAQKLALIQMKGAKGPDRLYHSPHRPDTNPSLSIFHSKGRAGFKDQATGDTGGDAIALHQYVRGMEFGETVRELAEMYHIPAFVPPQQAGGYTPREKTLAENIAERCLNGDKQKATAYLASRGITEKVIKRAINAKVVGWNDYHKKGVEIGTVGYGGEGVAFIVRDRHDQLLVRAVDTRYQNPDHNGGVKTNSQGEKDGSPFVVDWRRFATAQTVVICESAINVLSVLSCEIPWWDAIATRGTGTIDSLPTDIFMGKFVVIGMDYDKPKPDQTTDGKKSPDAGKRPGPDAAIKLYYKLTAAGIPCILLNQLEWELDWDLNDILQKEGLQALKARLQDWETCPIPGFVGGDKKYPGKSRIHLPADDYARYWRYQVGQDITKYISETKEDEEGNRKPIEIADIAGFRVTDVARVTIQPWEDTVHGSKNGSGETLFAVQAQTPQYGMMLQRTIFDGSQFADPAAWSKLGYIYKKPEFMRLTAILSRTMDSSAKLAVNYVGLCYKNRKLVINEGKDCYFKDALKQCPSYGHLVFNNGTINQAREVVKAFQHTFKQNAGLIPLVWALGAHLKVFFGFYPHLQMEAEKGSGKSTYLRQWAKALQTQVFSTQMLDTAFRIQQVVAYSGQPVAWEEISTLKPESAQAANQMLQQVYNYSYSVRGGTTPMLYSTPVLLTGEEVDMSSLIGKLTRTTLTYNKQGPAISDGLPAFPMRQWLEWLARLNPSAVNQHLEAQTKRCLVDSRSKENDPNAQRIVKNYACIRLAWHYLCEFLSIDIGTGYFEHDLLMEMNAFLAETEGARKPWVWIMEITFSEIDNNRYRAPVAYDVIDSKSVILLRATHIMDHIHHSTHLKPRWDALPIKTAKVFVKQLLADGVLITNENGQPKTVERTVNHNRYSNMLAFDLGKLAKFGLTITRDKLSIED